MANVLDILQLAREKERARKAAYEQAAAETKNPLAAATFRALAEQEDRHEQYLEKYYNKQVAEEGWPAPKDFGIVNEDFADVVKTIFKHANEQINEAGACAEGLTEVYAAGIAAETESIHFYEDAAAHATDPNQRKFYETLLAAERWHLKLLSETQEYLDDSQSWFFREEQWSVTG